MTSPFERAIINETAAGIEHAVIGAGDTWEAEAVAAVLHVASGGYPFSGNDVWRKGLRNPGDRRALGAIFRRLAAEGRIKPTGDKVVSRWGHGTRIGVWVAK